MQHMYAYRRGFRIFMFCLLTPFALIPLLSIYSMIMIPSEDWGFGLISICLSGLVVIFCSNEWLSVITSDSYGITYKSFLYKRELLWQDVNGYRIINKTLVLVSNIPGKRRFKVSFYRRNQGEIINWVSSRYQNLRLQYADPRVVEAYKAIDPEKMRRAKQTAIFLNVSATVLAVMTYFLRDELPWLPVLLILLALSALAMVRYHKGYLSISVEKHEVLPTIVWAIMCCGVGLLIYSARVYLVQPGDIWMVMLIVTGGLVALTIYCSQGWKPKLAYKIWGVAAITLFLVMVAFGSITFLNVYFDNSKTDHYQTSVAGKWISRRRATSYHLSVLPWGPVKTNKSFSVGSEVYEAMNINDPVNIEMHKGALGFPWYKLGKLKGK